MKTKVTGKRLQDCKQTSKQTIANLENQDQIKAGASLHEQIIYRPPVP
jgi:hypothetical protein